MYEIKNAEELTAAEERLLNGKKRRRGMFFELDQKVDQLLIGQVYVEDFDGKMTADDIAKLVPRLRMHFYNVYKNQSYKVVSGPNDSGRPVMLIRREA